MPEAGDAMAVPRVLIASASELSRSWFAEFPSHTKAFSILSIVALDGDLSSQVQELAPDLVILDVSDTEGDPLMQVLESVGTPAVDVVVLKTEERWRDDQAELMRAGARAILSHLPTLGELEAVIRAVAAGFVVLDADAASRVVPTTTNHLAAPPLTAREIDVLNALAEGHGNKQIAVRLGISDHTVKTHLAAIFEKLDVSNRTEAVMAGARLGLLLL